MRNEKVFLFIAICCVCFTIGFSLRHIEWQYGTPTAYCKVVALFNGSEHEAMYTGKYWTEYREENGVIMAFNGEPEKWRYTIW